MLIFQSYKTPPVLTRMYYFYQLIRPECSSGANLPYVWFTKDDFCRWSSVAYGAVTYGVGTPLGEQPDPRVYSWGWSFSEPYDTQIHWSANRVTEAMFRENPGQCLDYSAIYQLRVREPGVALQIRVYRSTLPEPPTTSPEGGKLKVVYDALTLELPPMAATV